MPTPNWLWAKSAGSTQWDFAGLDYGSSNIATNQFGHSHVVGTVGGQASFPPQTLTSTANPKIFVAKYDASGACLWVRQFGGSNAHPYGNKGQAIDTDGTQNCYATGTFHGSAGSIVSVGSGVTLTGTGQRQVFVVKYNPGGGALWARQPGGANANNYAKGIAVDFGGNSYITGYLGTSGVQFGGTTLAGPGAYVAKHDTMGTPVWATKIGANGNVDGASVDVDPAGRSYVTGYLQGTDTFPANLTLSSIGVRDVVLAAVAPSGSLVWVKRFGFAGNSSYGRGVSTDSYGNVFVTGDFENKIVIGATTLTSPGQAAFVAKFSMNGAALWARQASNSGSQANSVKASPTGECFIAGHYEGTAAFGNNVVLPSNGSRCTFVVKYDVNGNTVWGQCSTGTGSAESPMGISYDAFLNLYIAGNVQGPAQFGPHTLASYGGYDAFIAKLEAVCP